MQRRHFVSRVLAWGFTGTAACGVAGCGTFLHSERRGQPHGNQIDWKIAALDGLCLLLFFIPGVVAFAVDFSTGAIYLPMEPSTPGVPVNPQPLPAVSSQGVPSPQTATLRPTEVSLAAQERSVWHRLGLKRVAIPHEQLQQERIEQIATQYVGRRVSLDDQQTRVSVLPCLERFDEQANRHRVDRNFGVAVRSFFERLKQRAA